MRKRTARTPIVMLGALALGGCSVYQPFNSIEHTREESARRVGEDLVDDVEIPYELNDEVLEYITGRVNPAASDVKKVDQVLDLIFSGVGLEYRLQPTRDAVETFHAKQANCLSFTHLFVGIGRSQRMNPFYVEVEDFQRWSYQDGTVVSRGHIVAGMFIDGGMKTYDFLPYRAKAYRDFKDIDDLTAMSHHYNNLAAEALMDGDLVTAEKNLLIASRLDPEFDKAINNLGVLYMRRGELEKAIDVYEVGLVGHPEFVPILSNLSRAYRRVGRDEDAERVIVQLEELDHSNPFFYMYRGLEALEAGDHKLALERLREALSIDTEVPEIHLGLAKVYMAMGDLKKSRHHVERAIKLDATHPEARRFAQMFQNEGPPEIVIDGGSSRR